MRWSISPHPETLIMAAMNPPEESSPPESSDTEKTQFESSPGIIRKSLGRALSTFSDTVNSNLIIIRYGTLGSIVLLGAYGIANTPLFYRYKTLWHIPESMWRRRWLHGRIVGILQRKSSSQVMYNQGRHLSSLSSTSLKNDVINSTELSKTEELKQSQQNTHNTGTEKTEPVVILFRHSSPMERLLTQNAMDKLLSLTGKSSRRMLYSTANYHHNLLSIELVGISYPPSSPPLRLSSEGLLQKLADDKTRVSIQLLAHNASIRSVHSHERTPEGDEGTALCHVTYRKPNQWLRTTNLSLELVTSGQAVISSSLVPEFDKTNNTKKIDKNQRTLINFNPTPKQLHQDTAFMSQLEEAEYSAWKSRTGIWSLDRMRDLKPEYEEEDKYVSSLWSTRIWNVLKMGWGWIRR